LTSERITSLNCTHRLSLLPRFLFFPSFSSPFAINLVEGCTVYHAAPSPLIRKLTLYTAFDTLTTQQHPTTREVVPVHV
jgi:hypothetical protein